MKKLVEGAAPSLLPVSCDSIDLLLFVFLIFLSLVSSPTQGLEHVTGHAPAEATFNPLLQFADSSSHSGGGEVENKRVETGVEGAAQQGFVSPEGTLLCDEAHNVRDIVGAKAQCKDKQCSQCHPDGPQASAAINVMQLGQNPDEVDVAITRNEEGDAEKHHTELQTHRQEDL